jgi:hypothetical protein
LVLQWQLSNPMPIRLNLLAEAQAAEDMRRRDPVKRVVLGGAVLALVALVWGISLWAKAMVERGTVNTLEKSTQSNSAEFERVRQNRAEWVETKRRLESLQQLTTNRFLYGNLLNAFQQATVENIQIRRIAVRQEFAFSPESRASTNGSRVNPGKAATVTEKISLLLLANDSSRIPGDAIPSLRQTIGNHPYFQSVLGKTNEVKLKDYGNTQIGPDGKSYLSFTLECRFPEKTR